MRLANAVSYTVVDAFTTTAFSGNPAAIVIIDPHHPLSDETLQLLAREFNLSESGFLFLPTSSSHSTPSFRLRWFTPTEEIRLCGHATLAAAHILFSSPPYAHETTLHFETLSGVLAASRSAVDSDTIELEFPAGLTKAVDKTYEEQVKSALAKAMGRGDVDSIVRFIRLGAGRTFAHATLIQLDSSIDLASLVVDPQPLTVLAPTHTVFVLTTAAPPTSPYTFISRTFAPFAGVPEDPVTGATHCMLGPYWHSRLGLAPDTAMLGRQVSGRGGGMSVVWNKEKGTCRLGGKAVVVAEGTLFVPEAEGGEKISGAVGSSMS